MAPLSVLPGRVRYESKCLIGSPEKCRLLEERLLSLAGVNEASAAHRTGRILVRFDEKVLSRSEVQEKMDQALRKLEPQGAKDPAQPIAQRKARAREGSPTSAGHFLMEVALHALLPAPLDLLLPAAATALRR